MKLNLKNSNCDDGKLWYELGWSSASQFKLHCFVYIKSKNNFFLKQIVQEIKICFKKKRNQSKQFIRLCLSVILIILKSTCWECNENKIWIYVFMCVCVCIRQIKNLVERVKSSCIDFLLCLTTWRRSDTTYYSLNFFFLFSPPLTSMGSTFLGRTCSHL